MLDAASQPYTRSAGRDSEPYHGGSYMTDDDESNQRLAKLKRDQRARGASDRALEQLLSKGSEQTEEKLANVRATHRLDNRRVLSAVKHLLKKDLDT